MLARPVRLALTTLLVGIPILIAVAVLSVRSDMQAITPGDTVESIAPGGGLLGWCEVVSVDAARQTATIKTAAGETREVPLDSLLEQ